jgi:hypothetical protein
MGAGQRYTTAHYCFSPAPPHSDNFYSRGMSRDPRLVGAQARQFH